MKGGACAARRGAAPIRSRRGAHCAPFSLVILREAGAGSR